MHTIIKTDKSHVWYVTNTKGEIVYQGRQRTHDHALRAARNFIRHNQNLVFNAG